MPLETCPEGYINCPYEESHVILKSRIQFHLVKCKKVHPESRLVECPINSLHKVPEIELNCHKMYLCPDRNKIETFICSTEEATPLFPVTKLEVDSSENWDDMQCATYDPTERCQNMPILLNLQGATPSSRKNFRAVERQRHRSLAESSKPKVTEPPTRLPQTVPLSSMCHNDFRIDQTTVKGRGRGRFLDN